MITKHTKESLRKGIVGGFKGIFTISNFIKRPLKPWVFKVTLVIVCLFLFSLFILGVSPYETIQEIVSNCLSLLPGILGFTIGGYSFLIGFVQPELMNKISEPQEGSPFSLFQVASASFACNILIQGISLCAAYIFHFIIWLDLNKSKGVSFPQWWINGVNVLGVILITIIFAFSVVVILQLVVNVFNFSQLHHYNVNKIKFDQQQEEDKKLNPGT